MKRLLKTAFMTFSALVLPFTIATTAKAATTYADDIDTKLEYQLSNDGSDIRYISTMELKNDRTLNDITYIQMEFTISDGDTERSRVVETTTVYDRITGTKDQVDDTYYAVFKITDLTDNYTGWTISSNFTYFYSDSSSERVTASSWLIGGTRLYFKKIYSDWAESGTMYAYLYKGETYKTTWPGDAMQLIDSENSIYCYDYLPDDGFTTIKFNDGDFEGHHETIGLERSSTYQYYIQHNDTAYICSSFEHTIEYDTNEHFCSICGYKEVHTLTSTVDQNTGFKTVTCEECGFTTTFDPNVIYVTNSVGWDTIYAHMWNDTTKVGTTWPGTEMQKIGTNKSGQDVYKINLLEGSNYIIFNKGVGEGANQTVNIPLSSLGNYNAFYLIANGDWGNKTVGTWLCVEDDLTLISQE